VGTILKLFGVMQKGGQVVKEPPTRREGMDQSEVKKEFAEGLGGRVARRLSSMGRGGELQTSSLGVGR